MQAKHGGKLLAALLVFLGGLASALIGGTWALASAMANIMHGQQRLEESQGRLEKSQQRLEDGQQRLQKGQRQHSIGLTACGTLLAVLLFRG